MCSSEGPFRYYCIAIWTGHGFSCAAIWRALWLPRICANGWYSALQFSNFCNGVEISVHDMISYDASPCAVLPDIPKTFVEQCSSHRGVPPKCEYPYLRLHDAFLSFRTHTAILKTFCSALLSKLWSRAAPIIYVYNTKLQNKSIWLVPKKTKAMHLWG